MQSQVLSKKKVGKYYNVAFALAAITILYNIAEGLISVWLGYEDESLALFGFGSDSFIEVISGLGIAHMIIRIKSNPDAGRDKFEKTALKVTGTSFYLLAAGLVFSGLYNIIQANMPETTFWGIIISSISILTMGLLVWAKKRIGNRLGSKPILADADCTKVCLYMSVILLFSSGIYELYSIPYIDSLGAIGLAWFSFKEGKECFEKANKSDYECCC